jgi:hypothetical protein
VSACAAVLGIDDGHLRDDAGGPPGTVLGDGGILHDEAGNGTCEDIPLSDDLGVYVATDGTDGPSCGGRATPCKKVQTGIDRAADLKKSGVYVARGVYGEAIAMKSGVTVVGGWDVLRTGADATWSRACTSGATEIVAPDTESVTVRADAVQAVKLSTLSVKSKAAAAPGESLIGVLATNGSTATLVEVVVKTSDGGPGAEGRAGDAGAPGGGCDAGGDGAPGSPPGTPGDGAGAGVFGATGFTPASGTNGNPGAPGHNGTAAAPPTCVSCLKCNSVVAVCGSEDAGKNCGIGGTAGCGGFGGLGGVGGGGGGSSVALLAWNARVHVAGGALTSGNGGRGGPGGEGGGGGPGGTGVPGSDNPVQCATACDGTPALGCDNAHGKGLGCDAGGKGGPGALGGKGGDGAGGDSFAVVEGGGGVVTIEGGTAFTHGNGGASGTGAAGRFGDRGP